MNVDDLIASITAMSRTRLSKVRSDAEKRMHDARRLLEAIDDQMREEIRELERTPPNAQKTRQVVEAFTRELMTPSERALVQVLLDNPGQTSEKLSDALGWQGQSWHMHFGNMCKKREAQLWRAEPSELRDARFFSGILAYLSQCNRWTIRPDAATAFAQLGVKTER